MASGTPALSVQLDLGEVGEVACVELNGQRMGVRICPPYRFDVTHAVRPSANRLAIEVTSTLVNQYDEWELDRRYRAVRPFDPSGLLGPVVMEIG